MDEDPPSLVDLAADGSRAALEEILERSLPAMRAYVRQRIGETLRRKESTSDIVQSACREVLMDLDDVQFPSESLFRHWLFETVQRKIVDRARYHGAQKRDPAKEINLDQLGMSSSDETLLQCYQSFCTPSRHVRAREAIEMVEQAMLKLLPDYREVISLRFFEELSYEEIGEKMGRKPATVRVLLLRGVEKLNRIIEKD